MRGASQEDRKNSPHFSKLPLRGAVAAPGHERERRGPDIGQSATRVRQDRARIGRMDEEVRRRGDVRQVGGSGEAASWREKFGARN